MSVCIPTPETGIVCLTLSCLQVGMHLFPGALGHYSHNQIHANYGDQIRIEGNPDIKYAPTDSCFRCREADATLWLTRL